MKSPAERTNAKAVVFKNVIFFAFFTKVNKKPYFFCRYS
jgi:hypothetical protein